MADWDVGVILCQEPIFILQPVPKSHRQIGDSCNLFCEVVFRPNFYRICLNLLQIVEHFSIYDPIHIPVVLSIEGGELDVMKRLGHGKGKFVQNVPGEFYTESANPLTFLPARPLL